MGQVVVCVTCLINIDLAMALVYGFLKLNSIKKTAEYASAAAAIALKSKNTISDDISPRNIELILKESKDETK